MVKRRQWRAGGRRSTKAGPSGPATRPTTSRRRLADAFAVRSLNEGRPFRAGNPGEALRVRYGQLGRFGSLNEGRPFRAGNPGANAGRRRSRGSSALNEGRPFRAGNPTCPQGCSEPTVPFPRQRSTKAGPSGPATRWRQRAVRVPERRSTPAFRAGNPTSRTGRGLAVVARSTKAGPSGPATPRHDDWRLHDHDRRRSTKAGPSGPATRLARYCGGRDSEERLRSTKAGPSGPATPGDWWDNKSRTGSTKAYLTPEADR